MVIAFRTDLLFILKQILPNPFRLSEIKTATQYRLQLPERDTRGIRW
ncbi:Uncharacterised protein [Vibrio cholerae]|uniref:Uncharacterized protein n=1 Tax=Vibrio cholerae TaxID=666 RepID=A0A655QPN9_VIBCL|nr:Uncharacterised protein [Vibrio cholerae]